MFYATQWMKATSSFYKKINTPQHTHNHNSLNLQSSSHTIVSDLENLTPNLFSSSLLSTGALRRHIRRRTCRFLHLKIMSEPSQVWYHYLKVCSLKICYFPKFWISKYWCVWGIFWISITWFGMGFPGFWYFHGFWSDY